MKKHLSKVIPVFFLLDFAALGQAYWQASVTPADNPVNASQRLYNEDGPCPGAPFTLTQINIYSGQNILLPNLPMIEGSDGKWVPATVSATSAGSPIDFAVPGTNHVTSTITSAGIVKTVLN